jgi:hypothetical protein
MTLKTTGMSKTLVNGMENNLQATEEYSTGGEERQHPYPGCKATSPVRCDVIAAVQ